MGQSVDATITMHSTNVPMYAPIIRGDNDKDIKQLAGIRLEISWVNVTDSSKDSSTWLLLTQDEAVELIAAIARTLCNPPNR